MTNTVTVYSITQIPDISPYMEYVLNINLTTSYSCILVFKSMFRSDSVLVDIYIDEISDDTLIKGGVLLKNDTVICEPNYDLGFEYRILCADLDAVEENIDKNNANLYYLEFIKGTGEDWVKESGE